MLIEVTHVFRNVEDKVIKERILIGEAQIMMITPIAGGQHSRIIFSDRDIDIEESVERIKEALSGQPSLYSREYTAAAHLNPKLAEQRMEP